MAKRIKRDWHPNFKKYLKFITEHKNYAGIPFLYKKDGSIRWGGTGNGEAGQAGRAIHPTREKPCQICGNVMSLDCICPNKRNSLSAGAMSNAPDRLDGYHTYNLCCRSKQDTGRHKSNLARYGEDRRAYEN